jgi:hypothetical protein
MLGSAREAETDWDAIHATHADIYDEMSLCNKVMVVDFRLPITAVHTKLSCYSIYLASAPSRQQCSVVMDDPKY